MMNIPLSGLIVLLLPCLVLTFKTPNYLGDFDQGRKFSGYRVLTVVPITEDEVTWLAQFKQRSNSNCSLDWWCETSRLNKTVSLTVNPECVDNIREEFEEAGFSVQVSEDDLGNIISFERMYRALTQLKRGPFDWNEDVYHTLDEINERLNWFLEYHSDLVSTKHLATTYEGRDIKAIVIREPGPINKPVIWLDCGIHAREWVSPPTCMHAIDQLVQSVNSVNAEDNLLAVYDFYVLPVANPDGYAYTWASQGNRMWRGNRRSIQVRNFCVMGVRVDYQ